MPALIPRDFEQRAEPLREVRGSKLPAACAPFDEGVDVFGDGSCFAVELPGHARGQLGLFVRNHDHRLYFLVADACWTRAAFERGTRPHPITHLLFDDSRRYYDTLERLGQLHRREPELVIVPSHCEQTFDLLRRSETHAPAEDQYRQA